MATRAQKIRLGIFFLIGLLGIALLLALVIGRDLMKGVNAYYVAYEHVSVGGLETGSAVEYHGVRVGTVRGIRIDPDNPARVVVELQIQKDVPVRSDARANITNVGITGLKVISIRGGTSDARSLEPGEFIPPGSTSITENITGRAEVLAEKFERVLNNLTALTEAGNREKIIAFADNAGRAFAQMDTVLGENRRELHETMVSVRNASARFDSASALVYESAVTINSFVNGDTLRSVLSNTRDIISEINDADLAALVVEIGGLADRTNDLLVRLDRDVEQGSGSLLVTLERLEETIRNLHEASQLIVDDPSVLLRGSEVKGEPDERLEDE